MQQFEPTTHRSKYFDGKKFEKTQFEIISEQNENSSDKAVSS
jgi:hypothetical protein